MARASEAVADSLAPGERVGNYVVSREIGQGGWGRVYLAEHPGIHRKVAIKVLRSEALRDETSISRFFTEARAPNAIDSAHMVEVLDLGQTRDGRPYLIMEWLDGESLGGLLAREGALPIPRVAHIAKQIASALWAAHELGVIHRDLKPDNVFLQRRAAEPDFVKILDFGIAKVLRDDEVALGGDLTHRTNTGRIMGTPSYMSPEQCEGARALDHRTDIYSLGVILFEMLTGQKPFRGPGVGGVMTQHIMEMPQAPSELNAAIPPALEACVLAMLEKQPQSRTDSMQAVLRALEAIAPSPDGATDVQRPAGRRAKAPATLAIPPETTERIARRPRRWSLVVGPIALAVAAAGALATWRGDRGPPAHHAPVRPQPPGPPVSAIPAPAPPTPPAPTTTAPAPTPAPTPAAAPAVSRATLTAPARKRAPARRRAKPKAGARKQAVATKKQAPKLQDRPEIVIERR